MARKKVVAIAKPTIAEVLEHDGLASPSGEVDRGEAPESSEETQETATEPGENSKD